MDSDTVSEVNLESECEGGSGAESEVYTGAEYGI